MKKKGLGYEILVRMVIAVMFIVLAITVGRSFAEAIIPQTNEAHESFDDFAEFIKNTKDWTPGTSESKLLIMDESTMILGFSKGAGFIERHTGTNIAQRTFNVKTDPDKLIEKIVRPSRACGDGGACLCSCDSIPKLNTELGYYVCEDLRCHQMPMSVDFHGRINIEKLVPEGYTTNWNSIYDRNDFFVLGGFFLERFSSEYNAYPRFVTGIRKIGDTDSSFELEKTPPLFPRRLEITVKKQSDGDLLICPQQSCS